MSSVKLVAIDLDGTLLDSDRVISKRNREAVAAASERGIIVVLASGRIGWSVKEYQKELGLARNPMIGTNGCEIESWDGVRIQESWLAQEPKEAVLELAESLNIHVNGYSPNQLFFTQNGQFAKLYLSRVSQFYNNPSGAQRPIFASHEDLLGEQLLKLLFVSSPGMIDKAAELSGSIQKLEGCSMTRSESEYLEFLPLGISKGAALSLLAGSLGIDISETAAIGDYYNDLEMLQCAGVSAVPENAPDDLKEIADLVVSHHTEGGVAEFLDQL